MYSAYLTMGSALATVCSTGIAYSAAHITAGAVPGGFASVGMVQLIMGAVFPVGLIITVLTGAELFTGDAMLAPMAAFTHKVTWMQVINLWIFVHIGNLIGSVVFACIVTNGVFVSFDAAGVGTVTAFGSRAIAIAGAKTGYVGLMGFYSAFFKAIDCNWLVNLAIPLG
ncbi:MAG: formate/nitrite transporter family protein, partial [Methanomicrobiales archaeon]